MFWRKAHDEMKECVLPQGWRISFPVPWEIEHSPEGDQVIAYPKDNDLTVRISAMNAAKAGQPAPMSLMRDGFLSSVPRAFQRVPMKLVRLPGCAVDCVRGQYAENGEMAHRMCVGVATEGKLLSIGIFAKDPADIDRALPLLKTVRRV